MLSVTLKAPAKINVHLEVKGLRSDGFHSIVSIFQSVSLFDIITVKPHKATGAIEVKGGFDFPQEQNLIFKAAESFAEYTGIRNGVTLECLKNIPAGAGLGGGSSDAASTLIGLNLLFTAGLSHSELFSLAAGIGSDVPFFISSSTALVTGRGDVIHPLETKWDLPVILIDTGIHISTPSAYKKIDLEKHNKNVEIHNPLEMYEKSPDKWEFYNDFLNILSHEAPVCVDALKKLDSLGALFSSLSGSGSAVYGIFGNEKAAKYAEVVLKNKFRGVIRGKMLANTPMAVYNSINN